MPRLLWLLLAAPLGVCGLLACAWAWSPVASATLPAALNTLAAGGADLLRWLGCGLAVSVLVLSVTGASWLMSRVSSHVPALPPQYATWQLSQENAIETIYRGVHDYAETGFSAD